MLPQWALIDSGASHTAIPKRLARLLGFEYDEPRESAQLATAGTAAGPVRVIKAKSRLWVPSEVGGFYIDQPIIADAFDFIFLGQYDFFRSFIVTFHRRELRMDIQPLPAEIGFRPN